MCYRCLVLVQNQTEALEYGQLCVNKRAKSALQSIVSLRSSSIPNGSKLIYKMKGYTLQQLYYTVQR